MEAGFIPASLGVGGLQPSAALAAPPSTSVIRAPGLKRGRMEAAISDRIKLESVFGLTVNSNAALDCDPNGDVVAYPAGCTVVLYNATKNKQTHVLNSSRKSVTCVAFSKDGRYLATGECGHAPCVRVWDLKAPGTSAAVQIGEFPGHSHGVSCVAFSTSSKYLVSVGSQHDMIVNVWDWRSNLKLASNKVSSRVKAVSFSESGNYFVTVGFRHVKFWYLEYSRNAKIKEPVPLMGRSAILGEQKDNEFCDVRCGRADCADSTYAITRGGLLCEFNARRLLDKWVDVRTASANCMAIGSQYIFIGCAEGIVRVFCPRSLQYVTTLPRAHYLGVDVAQGVNISHMFTNPPEARYPDAVALTYDEHNNKLTCIYNDHSLYVWDVKDIMRVGKSHSALYHSACIWGVDMLPSGEFLTCSSDDTVRVWALNANLAKGNIYSNELQKVMYMDPELKFLKDVDLSGSSENDKSRSYDEKTGVRCVRVSPCGAHVASGDRAGNVRVHCVRSGRPLQALEAHDAEVLCLEYATHTHTGLTSPVTLLASASRDRLIHVFHVDKGYQILQTLDEHSSSITAVRFLRSPSNALTMVSCGADKTILFRHLKTSPDGALMFARGQNVCGRSTLYDMEVDAGGRHVLAACQDRHVRVYSAAHARHTKTFRGTPAEDGTLIKVSLDSSGIYLATSSTDKILAVYDYYSGECMATMFGHSEIVTGLKFTPDCQYLISAGGDGCVFVWRVPHDMVVTMRARLAQQAIRHGRKVPCNGVCSADSEAESQWGSPPRELPPVELVPPVPTDYTLRIGQLPSWAKKSLGDDVTSPAPPPAAAARPPAAPEPPARGKWATRVVPPEKRVDSDGSKDSSLDSGTDTRFIEKRRDQSVKQVTINLSKPRGEQRVRHHTDDSSLGSFKYEDQESTEHDGDIEDISDGERTSSSERGNRPTYYPGNNDDDTPSEFMVNAIDIEELRKSVRKSRRRVDSPHGTTGTGTGTTGTAATSLSGSPLHSDDDEVSTPSGDNAERTLLSGSSESLELAGRRSKYLQSAFDSLSGAEMDANAHANGHNSLSSQHLSRPRPPLHLPSALPSQGGNSPSAPPSAPSPAPRKAVDPEAARRREELNRRILETRRQLDDVEYRSTLKSSQSTTDLSYIPEKDSGRRNRPVSMAVPTNNRTYGFIQEDALDSLNSNYYDSLNPSQNFDYRNKNPYAIPANLNHKIPEYVDNVSPYVPPHANFGTINERPKKQALAFTIDIGKNSKTIESKVFDRLFPQKCKSTVDRDKRHRRDCDKHVPPKVPPRNFHLQLKSTEDNTDRTQKVQKPARSIFKNYKSCPVSPVSEECKWSDKVVHNAPSQPANDSKKRNSLSFFVGLDNKIVKDNGKSLVDTIKSDTEKMIAEITEKYGDLDEYEPRNDNLDLDFHPTKDVDKDDGNFSSDSLEDCSLSQDASCKNKLYSKKICRKHNKSKCLPRRAISDYEISLKDKPAVPLKPSYICNQKSSTLPRNMPSNLDDIIDEMEYNANNFYRCQSVLTKRCVTKSNESVLSDNSNCSSVSNEVFLKYGNEVAFQQAKFDSRYIDSQNCSFENLNEPDDNYFGNHRHSSASFFLNQRKMKSCSQESVLSDEMFLDDNQLSRTNCNSLESVLSDDSECTRSAPLEMLFEGTKAKRMQRNQSANMPRSSKSCYEFENTSKSYGSSPNNVPQFGNYMCGYNLDASPKYTIQTPVSPQTTKPTNKVYGFDVPNTELSGHKSVTRSKSLYDSTKPPPAKNIAYYFDGNNVQQYSKGKCDEIPRLKTEYMASTSKSLQPKFDGKFKYKSEMDGCEQNAMIKSKSCSFEVVLEPASKPNPLKNLMEKRNSHVQKNLEKFEEQIRKNSQSKSHKNHVKEKSGSKNSNTTKSLERGSGQKNISKVTMEFVPHKPPKPIKRTGSAKMNNRVKAGLDKPALSPISSQYKAKLDGLHNKNYITNKKIEDKNSNIDTTDNSEKTFDVYVKEKDVNENKSEMQMDSLEVYALQRMERMKHVSMDSLDVIEDDFAKDSLDYYAEQSNNRNNLKRHKEQINAKISKIDPTPCHSRQDNRTIENLTPDITDETKKYKYIERKIEIINKLVEMEERKILQEKALKEWRMRPLKANIDDGKGVVKVLSRKFEKLATKQTTVPNFASLTLEEADTDAENSDNREIKRNLSLPDILDSEKIGLVNPETITAVTEKAHDVGKDSNEPQTASEHVNTDRLNNSVKNDSKPKNLKQRVYNEMIIPKTDVHLDSENYESSTTSSSCTNSPKRLSLSFYGFNRPKTPFRKVVRVLTPRLCMENKPRPVIGFIRASSSLAKKIPLQNPVLPSKFQTQANRTNLSPLRQDEESSGMRRAISLSDLAVKPMPAPRAQGPPKQQPAQNGNASKSSGFVRPAPRHSVKSNMTRSSSVGVLNQSDSESDGQPSRQQARSSGLMRPTISSMNKQNSTTTRRRGLANAYSAMSLTTGAQEESSSEADESRQKPAVPPRPRAGSVDHTQRRIGRSGSERDLSAKAREVTARLTAGTRPPRQGKDTAVDSNLSSMELSALSQQLTKTASKVVQLYRSLQREPNAAADISGLEAAILETQKVLRGAVSSANGQPNSLSSEDRDSDINTTRQRLEGLVNNESIANNPAMSLIEQYSDILLNMMQSKMVNQFSQSPQSLPPNSARENES